MRLALTLSAIAVCAALSGCGKKDDTAGLPLPLTDAEKAALIASLPEPYHSADLTHGEALFGNCKSCHSIERGGKNLTGPNLYGVFGRVAGTKKNFDYSDVVKSAGFAWDADHLDGWLSGPRNFLKGTKMSFSGLKDPTDRRDLIVYLMTATGYRSPAMTGGAAATAPAAPK